MIYGLHKKVELVCFFLKWRKNYLEKKTKTKESMTHLKRRRVTWSRRRVRGTYVEEDIKAVFRNGFVNTLSNLFAVVLTNIQEAKLTNNWTIGGPCCLLTSSIQYWLLTSWVLVNDMEKCEESSSKWDSRLRLLCAENSVISKSHLSF